MSEMHNKNHVCLGEGGVVDLATCKSPKCKGGVQLPTVQIYCGVTTVNGSISMMTPIV